jgi:ubiquinone/menaquinone biosynthesis C-methylase UbiE
MMIFQNTGVDISPEMISLARTRDPRGKYYLIEDGDFSPVETNRFNLILCAFPFDNIPTRKHKVHLLTLLGSLLAPEGRIVNIVSTPEIYIHEWVTFTTRDYPENHHAVCGDIVRIITKEYSDERPVEDILWTDEDYQSVYRAAGLSQILNSTPLATGNEGIDWVNETRIAPWRIYVVEREGSN